MNKLDKIKTFVAKNRPVLAIGIVVTATIAAVAIDVALRDDTPIDLDAIKEA